ncbi:MAG: hypothetical protein JO034_03355, partial [Singulisphaera sp.]|nr:hypothetical protein [Singulisphaera sp.]
MMGRRDPNLAILVGVVLVLGGPGSGRAQVSNELEKHLEELQGEVDDPNLKIEDRQRLAMELAATLDRAAQAAPTADGRRAYWSEAVRRLDQFRARNPGMPHADRFQFQAAVDHWARARSWRQQWELSPADRAARDHAVADFDAALERLRPLGEATRGSGDLFAQNVRFRLAESLADRAELEPEGDESRSAREREALEALEPVPSEPSLQGFARLLRGELLTRLGKADQALPEVDTAAKAMPPPPARDVLEVRIGALIGLGRFDDALTAVASSPVEGDVKGRLAVRVRLAGLAAEPPGAARAAAESALFAQVKELRESGSPEARLALVAVARDLPEPEPGQGPDSWDAMAEG